MTLKDTMVLNGKEYKIPELNFSDICKLEDMGVSLIDEKTKVFSTLRAFIALCVGGVEEAEKEISEHMRGGNPLNPLFDALALAMEKSGFFQELLKSQGKTAKKSKE